MLVCGSSRSSPSHLLKYICTCLVPWACHHIGRRRACTYVLYTHVTKDGIALPCKQPIIHSSACLKECINTSPINPSPTPPATQPPPLFPPLIRKSIRPNWFPAQHTHVPARQVPKHSAQPSRSERAPAVREPPQTLSVTPDPARTLEMQTQTVDGSSSNETLKSYMYPPGTSTCTTTPQAEAGVEAVLHQRNYTRISQCIYLYIYTHTHI